MSLLGKQVSVKIRVFMQQRIALAVDVFIEYESNGPWFVTEELSVRNITCSLSD